VHLPTLVRAVRRAGAQRLGLDLHDQVDVQPAGPQACDQLVDHGDVRLGCAVEQAASRAAHTAALFPGARSTGNLRLHARAGDVERRREPVDDRLTSVHLAEPLRWYSRAACGGQPDRAGRVGSVSRPLGPAFWRLFAASASSNLADGVNRVALPLLAATLTRDPVLVAALTSLAHLPWLLFALPAGAVVDRVDRTRAMAAANAARALALGVLVSTVLTGTASLPVLYAVAFAVGAAETVYDSAARAVLPQVVRRDQLDRGNGLITVGETASESFLGAPVGSALFAVAIVAPLLTTTGAFLLAAVLVLGIAGGSRPERVVPGPRTTIRRDVAEGVAWLWRHRFLRGLTAVSAMTSLLQSMTTGVLVLYALETLRIGEAGFGLLLTASGAGAVVGGLVAARVATRIGRSATLVAGAALAAAATLALGFTSNGVVAGVLLGLGAAGVMFWNVLTMSLRQALIPAGLFGRVQGAYRTLVWGGIPLGALAGGLLAGGTSVPTVFVVAGCALLVLAGVLERLLAAHRDVVVGAFAVPGPR
jgi:MFS family permease